MAVTLCVFDYDDTLVQTRQCKFRAVKALGRRYYRTDITDGDIDRVWGAAYRDFFTHLFSAHDRDVGRVIARYEALDAEFPVAPFDDAVATVHRLADRMALGIVSACGRELLTDQLRRLAFPVERLLFVLGAEDTPHHKPDPRVFLPIQPLLASRGLTSREVLYVGDSERDRLAAVGAGFHFVGLEREEAQGRLMRERGAVVVGSLGALADAIEADRLGFGAGPPCPSSQQATRAE